MKNRLKSIISQFKIEAQFKSYQELNSGHINDTFLVKTDGSKNYILQRINHTIFKNVPGLVNNKVLTSIHLKSKYPNLSEEELSTKVLSFVKAKNSDFYFFKKILNLICHKVHTKVIMSVILV